MRRLIAIFIVIFASACGSLPSFDRHATDRNGSNPPANAGDEAPLRIFVIDVGQGDATLIVAPTGEAMLVDAGPPGAGSSAILPLLESEGVGELDAIVVTHYHEDHFGGMPEVLEEIPTGGVYDRGQPQSDPESPLFPLYESAAGALRRAVHPGQHFVLGDVGVAAVASGGLLADGTRADMGDPPDENAASVVLLISYAGFKMLIAADATGGGGDPPYQTPDVETSLAPFVGTIDVLRVGHHGSKTSTNAAFLAATKPAAAIISVGDGNDYHHPHASVIERLLAAGVSVYQTERGWLSIAGPIVANGDVVVEVDGEGTFRIDF